MKTNLEVLGSPAQFSGERVRYNQGGWLVPHPRSTKNDVDKFDFAPVTICAWCDADKSLKKKIELAGYKVSHGICETCKTNVLNKLK